MESLSTRFLALFARVALPALAATACSSQPGVPQGGSDVGNGATEASINLHAYLAPAATAPTSLKLDDGARIDELWMVVDRIRLRPGTTCSGNDTEIDVRGPLVADLLGSGILGGPAVFPITAGPFCRFQLGFQKLNPNDAPPGAPPDLSNLSILMKGARSDGVPFTVEADFGEEFEIEAKNGSFALAAGKNPLFVAFELTAWMAALDLDSLSGSPILISDQTNKDRLDALDMAVQASERLFSDQNQDGVLSPNEETSGNQLTQ